MINERYDEISGKRMTDKFPPSKLEANIDTIKACRNSQTEEDDYTRGFYNGLECALSILEIRNPEYKRSNMSNNLVFGIGYIEDDSDLITDPSRIKQMIEQFQFQVQKPLDGLSLASKKMMELIKKGMR